MLNCLLIQIFFVVVIDQLHFMDEITSIVSGWMTGGKIRRPMDLKPFTCSTCMGWWSNLIYIIATGCLSVPMVAYIVGLSWAAPVIDGILTLVKNIVVKLLNTIAYKLNI
jgi:hypothetical protein